MGEVPFLGYRCSICGREFLPGRERYNCPDDDGNLDVIIDTHHLAGKGVDELINTSTQSIWRYLSLLPVTSPGIEHTPLNAVGWTPMFTKAGAVVAESGGMLSHSSIVAREYGIPAVVSVTGACKLLDRKVVTVDGFRGKVIIHD